MGLSLPVPGGLCSTAWNGGEKGRPEPHPPYMSLLRLTLSIRQAGPSITDDIDLDRWASQEPIITGSFNQLMPIQLLLNLVLTWRKQVGMDKRIAGTNSPG